MLTLMKGDKGIKLSEERTDLFCSEYTGTDIVFAKSSSLVMPLIDVPCTVLSSDCNFL